MYGGSVAAFEAGNVRPVIAYAGCDQETTGRNVGMGAACKLEAVVVGTVSGELDVIIDEVDVVFLALLACKLA